jgi:hypothetical protein
MWVLALGPSLKFGGDFVWEHAGKPVSWLPYRLVLTVPALGALRAPFRTGYVLVAVLVAATAIALHRVLSDRRNAVVVAGGAALLLATNLLLPLPTDTLGTTAASERALRQIARTARSGDTVLAVPADCDPTFVSYQVFHHAPVVGCAGSFAANPWQSELAYTRSDSFTKLRCDRKQYGRIATKEWSLSPFGPEDVAQLRQHEGVRFLVIDRRRLGDVDCVSVNAAFAFLTRYRSLGGDRELAVLDLSRLRDG